MINSLTATTYERHFFGGMTSFEAIDAADRFNPGCGTTCRYRQRWPTLSSRSAWWRICRAASRSVLYVTPRQWHDFYTSSSGKIGRRCWLPPWSAATGLEPPIFREGAMWRGILVKPHKGMPIRFNQGSTVKVVAANSATGAK